MGILASGRTVLEQTFNEIFFLYTLDFSHIGYYLKLYYPKDICHTLDKIFAIKVKTVAYMRELRVTHVINTASRDVWLPTEKLSNMGVELFQFHVDDVPTANIAPFFRPVADIVRRAQQSGGLLVINCLVGFSRSATVLIAALMIVRHWTLAHAFRALRLRRQVKPNLGFMAQLISLEIQLKQQGVSLL